VFGLFKSKQRKLCDKVGQSIHQQLYSITSSGDTVFNNPEEAVFFCGYLELLLSSSADYEELPGLWAHDEANLKYICDGVIPNAIWVVYKRGQGMVSVSDGTAFDVVETYELGKKAGWADAFDGLSNSGRLLRFLKGQDLALELD